MNFADIIDKWILVYVAIASVLTEAVMRMTPEEITRRRFAMLASAVFAMGASFLHGWTVGTPIPVTVWRGLIAIAVANSGYDFAKTIWANIVERKK